MNKPKISYADKHRILRQSASLVTEWEERKPLSASVIQELLTLVGDLDRADYYNRQAIAYLLEVAQKYVIAERMTEEEREVCQKLAEQYQAQEA